MESEKYNKPVNITKKKQTKEYREQSSGYHLWVGGRHKLSGERQAQGCIVQHREYSQYFVVTVNGK